LSRFEQIACSGHDQPYRPPSALGPHRRSTKEGNSAGAGAIPSHIQAQLDTAKKLLTRMGSGLDKHSSLSAAEQQGARPRAGS
jgi:hypothetical protein